MKETAEFAKVDLSTMQVQQKPDNLYDVYSDEENSVVVQADTAYEAIKKSGIVSPYKVEHKLKFTELILADSDIIMPTNKEPSQDEPRENQNNENIQQT